MTFYQDELHNFLSAIWGFVPARSLQVAVESGFIDFVHMNQPCSPESISKEMGWKDRPVKILASVLQEINVLIIDDNCGTFALTPFATKWLTDTSGNNLQSFVIRSKHLLEEYLDFENIALNDEPSKRMKKETLQSFGGNKDLTRTFGLSMHAMSLRLANELMNKINLNWANTMLDVGCGWGTFSLEFSKKWKQLSFDLLDLPGVIDFVNENIAKENLENRANTIGCNWREGIPLKKYDVVLLSQVLHEETKEHAKELFSVCVDRLTDKGKIIVVGFHPTKDSNNRLIAAIFGMNMIVELGTDNPSPRFLSELCNSNSLKLEQNGYLFGGRSFWIWKKRKH